MVRRTSRWDAETIQGLAWNVNLMIDPGAARYFYRVESRSVDARWFFWIDADTGAIVNEYDGLTTGSGLEVLGDMKNLPTSRPKAGPPIAWCRTTDARDL